MAVAAILVTIIALHVHVEVLTRIATLATIVSQADGHKADQ